jgi:transposase, IS30 family
MGRKYERLSLEDRCEIARLQAEGQSVRQIAAALDRAPSTISRQIRRNGGHKLACKPWFAQQPRRVGPSGPRLVARAGRRTARARGRPPRDQLRKHLALHLRPDRPHQGLPPAPRPAPRQEQTRLPRQKGRQLGKLHCGRYFAVRTAPRSRRSQDPRPLGSRPHAVLQIRLRPCSPSMREPAACCSPGGRPTRPPRASLNISCASSPVGRKQLRKSVTFDNGTEFARHRALHRLAIKTFFCDRYAPWQKGGVENVIGRMRRFISAQDRPRNAVRPTLQRPRSCLQQHPQKMS